MPVTLPLFQSPFSPLFGDPLAGMWGGAGPPALFMVEGDSITTNDYATAYPSIFSSSYAARPVDYHNLAVSGSRVANLNVRAAAFDAIVAASTATKKILSLLIGANDLYDDPADVATFTNAVAAYIDARRAAGITHVLLGTILPRTSGVSSFEPNRATSSTTFKSWLGGRVDRIFDFAASPLMGAGGASANTLYFLDGTHPADRGQLHLETIYRGPANSLLTGGAAVATAPLIVTPSSLTVSEGVAFSTVLDGMDDNDGTTLTWTKTGGADAALFSLIGSTLSMTARDYDVPTDANGDNIYQVSVTATDSDGLSTSRTISVTVTDVVALSPLGIFGSNLVAWYDAQDASSITKDGSNRVSQWNDKSGNGYHLVQNANGAALYSATGLSSKPCMVFRVGTTIYGGFSAAGVALGADATCALFSEIQLETGVGDFQNMAAYQGLGEANDYAGGSMRFLNYDTGTIGPVFLSSKAIALDVPQRAAAVFTGTQAIAYVNGSAGTPVANSTARTATGTLIIGGSLGNVIRGRAGEIILVKSAPTSQQLADMDTYLAGRW